MDRRIPLLALILMPLLAAGCGSGGTSDFNLISIEEEWQLGAQLSGEVARQVRFNNDPAVNAYVERMGRQIVASAPAPFNQLPWQFHVVEDPALNAFAIPGGHVYVHTGLIANAGNASELAGVIGHEISHIVARHTTEQISRQYGLSVLAGAVLGQNPGLLAQMAAQIAAGGAMARFSREAEREADEIGLQAMARAGYDPRGVASMFRRLLAARERAPGRVEKFFATHPPTEERVRAAEQRAAQLASQQNVVVDEPAFQDVKRRVGG